MGTAQTHVESAHGGSEPLHTNNTVKRLDRYFRRFLCFGSRQGSARFAKSLLDDLHDEQGVVCLSQLSKLKGFNSVREHAHIHTYP